MIDPMTALKLNARRLIGAALTVLAFSPPPAFAGGGAEASKQWLEKPRSTHSAQEFHGEPQGFAEYGRRPPVEVQVVA